MATEPSLRGEQLAALLGSADLWARATALLRPTTATHKKRSGEAIFDPLQIVIEGTGPVIRPKPGAGCDYGIVGSIAELREYLRPSLQDRVPFGADWETTSLNTRIARPVGFSASVGNKTGRYVPVGHELNPDDNLPANEVLQVLKECDAAGADSLWYNAGYDIEVEANAFQWEPVHWHDVQIAIFLINSNVIELNLKTTALRLLGRKMQSLEELDEEWILLSKKAKRERPAKLPHQLPVERVAPYGCDDAECTRELWFHPETQAAIADQRPVFQLEEALIPGMREGVGYGVYLDTDRLREVQQDALAKIAQIQPEIYQLLQCEPFKLSRREVLADYLVKLVPEIADNARNLSAKGKILTNKKILDKFRAKHPVISKLIQYAELEAQERLYIRKLIAAHEYFRAQPWAQGRVRFAFNSIGVPTGRMKCGGAGKGTEAYLKGMADVNSQSIPDVEKAPYLPNTRAGIVAPDGYELVALDFEQVELRIAANESGEPLWIEAFKNGEDIHTKNAQQIANKREPGVIVTDDDKMRRGKAKTTSFALLYGGDESTVARNAGIPESEAREIFEAYFAGLGRLKQWIDERHQDAKHQGQVRTFFGRVRHLENYFRPEPAGRPQFWNGKPRLSQASREWKAWWQLQQRGFREAINDPIQGGAADIFKLACVRLRNTIRARGWGHDIISPIVLWVHDEVVFYVKHEWMTRVVPQLIAAMEIQVRSWPVPITVSAEVGSRRLYAKAKAAKARKGGDEAAAQRWDTIAALPEHRNWGELVPYDVWCARYAPQAVA